MAVMNAWGGVRIEALRPDSSGSISDALAQLRELARVERIVCAAPVEIAGSWVLDRFHADDLQNAGKLRRLLASYLMRANDMRADDRNVLVDLRQRVAEFQASRICLEVLRPLQLHRHHVSRALVCEGDTLLAWFAVFHAEPLTVQQSALFDSVLPSFRRRLASERRHDDGPVLDGALQID